MATEQTNGLNGVEESVPSPFPTTATAATTPGELSSAEILMQQHALPEKQLPPSKPAEGGQSRALQLDFASPEAFPSLGGSRKGSPNAAAPPASWGAGMATPATNGRNKGNNNSGNAESFSGAFTPAVPGSRGQSTIDLQPAQKRPTAELRRPAGELIMEIMKNTATRIEMQQTATQTTVFIISGIEANRQRAIREIYKEMSAKKSTTLTIPAIVRPYIIGKAGSKVQELEKMTLTKIRVLQMQVSDGPPAEYDDEETIDITIEGDEYGVPTAVAKINEIVAERTIFVTTRMFDIPGELYPFLQGPHGKNIGEFQKKVQRVTVPDYFFTAKSSPFSPPSDPIVITGEKPVVREVRAEIEQMVEQMKSAAFQSVIFPADRMKHRLFTANKGRLIHDILAASGCTVILPLGGGHDRLIIYGPPDRISLGKQEVQKSVDAYQTLGIDVCKAYPKALGGAKLHSRDVTRHLISKEEFKKLGTEFDAEITIPPREELCDLQSNSCVIRIIAKSKEGLAALQTRIQALYSKFSPDRLARFEVEPLHHRLITGKDGRGVQRITSGNPGISLLLPTDSHDSEIILLYDGTSDVVEEIATSLGQAKEQVLGLVESQKFDVAEKVISVSQHLHAKIQGEGGSTLNALNPSSVLVHFGAPKVRPGHPAAAASPDDQDMITLRGPKGNVESTVNSILAFVKSIPEDGNLPIITEAFPYPSHLSPRLIGAKGANINKLRHELGVEINLKEGQGEIKGIQVAVDAAKRKLSSQVKEFLDKAVEHLKVPQEFHSALIGSGGNGVRNLENTYGVRIMFPRSAKDKSPPDTDGGEIATKQGSNGVAAKGGKDGVEVAIKQDPNEVIIKGGKDGVAKARAGIVALLEREIEKNHTATVPVTPRAIEFMFKNAAKEIKQLRDDQTIRIDIPQRNAVGAPGEKLAIKIRGTEGQVKHAKTILSRIVKEAEQTTSRTISVEKKYHRALIGTGGRTLKEIVVAAGGPEDRQALARMVRFPSQESEGDEVTVQGDIAVVEKIIKAIEKIVEEKQSQISTIIEVVPEKHRLLIGREGSIRKELEARFGIIIDIPRQRPGQAASSPEIKLTGMEENVEKAKEHILEMVKESEGETVQVPRHLYHTVSEALRRLPREYRVSVEHAGQPRPQRAEETKPELNEDLPLITDDDDGSQGFAWRVVEQIRSSEDEEPFPWVLRGKAEAIAKAKAEIEKVVAAAEERSNIGYLVLPDPSKFRFVVGHGGSQVDKIRRDTGCRVIVPRGQIAGEPITIQGSKGGVEAAKDIILGLVRGGGGGGANGAPNGAGRGRRR